MSFKNNVAFPGVATALKTDAVSASFAPDPFVSSDEELAGAAELADLDQGSTQDFPIQGYVVTQAWAQKYPNTLKAFTTALSQGQEIADTNRALWRGLSLSTGVSRPQSQPSSRCLLPACVDAVRLQRVVNAMLRFKLLLAQANPAM